MEVASSDHTYCKKMEMSKGKLFETNTVENKALCSDMKTSFED